MRTRAVLDLRDQALGDVLRPLADRLGADLDPAGVVYGGEDGATAGIPTTRGTWARLQHRARNATLSPAWDAEEAAAALVGVRKPRWHRALTLDDPDRGVEWRLDELDHVREPVLGNLTAGLTAPGALTDHWWSQLQTSLTALARFPTDRVALDQPAVTRLITRVFAHVDTTVIEWSTAHGDLHWGNLTSNAHLIDFEAFGRAPRGLDAATLWGMALPRPAIAEQIRRRFAEDMNSRTGRLMQLMWCATALHAAQRRTDLDHFARPAAEHAQQLATELVQ